MAKKILSEAEINQLCFILSDIAQQAKAVRRLAIQIVGENEPEMVEVTPGIIQSLAQQIGWAADLASEKIGSVLIMEGTADGWMMPPSYHDAKEVAHG